MPKKKNRGRPTTPLPYSVPAKKSKSKSCLSCGELNSGSRITCSACDLPLNPTQRRTTRSSARNATSGNIKTDNQPMDAISDSSKAVATSSEGSSTSSQTTPTHRSPDPSTRDKHEEQVEEQTSEIPPEITNDDNSKASDNETIESVENEQKLPDFMSALNMRPSLPESGQSNHGDSIAMDTDKKSELSLIEKYRQDPNGVLGLLKSALSPEKLTELLSNEHNSKTEELKQLQTKLEGAYETLKSCSEHKEELTKNIHHTNELVKAKRKHLEELRDELKLLGEEEATLMKKRDQAQSTHDQLSKKLQASRDALQQITILEKTEQDNSNP